jgi:uncharacterized protein (TIGR03067 family)
MSRKGRHALVVGTLTITAGLAAGGPDNEGAAELKRLAGSWQAVSYALDGKEAPAEDLKKVKLRIDAHGKTAAQSEGKTFLASTIRVDPGWNPKTIDIAFTEGDRKGKTALGIYKLDGDTLTICRANPGKDRPSAFSSTPGSGLTLMSYRRDRP